jgi:sulfur-oxidizing protein SoxY
MKPGNAKTSRRITSRREFLLSAGGIAAGAVLELATTANATAQSSRAPSLVSPGRSAPATQASVAARLEAIRRVVGTAPINKGKVTVDLPALVDNGNGVSLAVSVDSPMTQADHVKAIHVFSEKNPLPEVVSFHLGPRAGRASVATRIRLADTQTVTAICEMSDGSFWSGSADAVVTLAACLEEI